MSKKILSPQKSQKNLKSQKSQKSQKSLKNLRNLKKFSKIKICHFLTYLPLGGSHDPVKIWLK